MEPDIIKVDMSLVQRIHEDPNRQLIPGIISLDFAGQNHITVLAEGVETKEELGIPDSMRRPSCSRDAAYRTASRWETPSNRSAIVRK